MGYRLLDENNHEVKLHNLQDKGPWCKTGATFEEVFVEKYGKKLSLKINPEKVTNPYAPDLLNTSNGLLGDLKTQNTPFFQAKSRYRLDPQMAVTFNVKDFTRYSSKYPSIEIYFWVKWIVTAFENDNGRIGVLPMEKIYKIPFEQLSQICKSSPIHTYAQRYDDNKGNARDSYVLNLNLPSFQQVGP